MNSDKLQILLNKFQTIESCLTSLSSEIKDVTEYYKNTSANNLDVCVDLKEYYNLGNVKVVIECLGDLISYQTEIEENNEQ